MAPRVCGIDLGTTNCCLAACEGNTVRILDIDGQRFMPSYAAFTETTYMIGREAKEQVHSNPSNTVLDSKRLIGRDFHDREVQNDINDMHWPFLVQANESGRPSYVVRCLGEDMTVLPETIAQLLLTKMKDVAQAYFGAPLDGAVITVPAYFNDAQRQATKIAAMQANITVLHMGIINEPTAAALAYAKQFAQDDEKTALIFDLGGGTFDVSLVTIEDTLVEVKGVDGNNHLGGEDVTNNILRYFIEDIKTRYQIDLLSPEPYRAGTYDTPAQLGASAQRAMLRLKTACEDIKCELSKAQTSTKILDYLWPAMPQYEATIDRKTFEDINKEFFSKCMACTKKVLKKAKIEPAGIDFVVLVGGSTRIPKIKKLLANLFGKEKICDTVNPDEVVAYGAAVQAASLSGLSEVTLLDVTSHSLGVATYGDVQSVVFPKDFAVGSTKERAFTTTADWQTIVRFDIYEGENPVASRNRLLDTFSLNGLPSLPAGQVDILVKFKVNFDGTLSATATDRSRGGTGQTTRKNLKISRKKEESAVKEAAAMAKQATKLAASKHRNRTATGPKIKSSTVDSNVTSAPSMKNKAGQPKKKPAGATGQPKKKPLTSAKQ